MNKIIIKNVLFILLICSNIVQGQTVDYYLFQVEYANKFALEEQPVGYTIFAQNEISKLIQLNDSNYPLPSIIYGLTKNGGYYVWNSNSKEQTYACNKYHDVSKSYSFTKDDSILSSNSSFFNGNLLDFLKNIQPYNIKVNNRTQKYQIKCWKISGSVCICPLFMNTPQHPIFKYEGAYIMNIRKSNYLNSKEKKMISAVMLKLVNFGRKSNVSK